MELSELSTILDELGIPHDNLVVGGKNKNRVNISCPYAPWTHDAGADYHPSMSIWLDDESPTYYRCWGCHEKGYLWEMVRDIGSFLKDDRLQALALNLAESDQPTMTKILGGVSKRLDEWGGVTRRKKLPSLKSTVLDRYPKAWESPVSKAYLQYRKIPEPVVYLFNLVHDIHNDRLLFPVYDSKLNLRGAVGRALRDGVEPKYYNYFGFESGMELGGIDKAVAGRRTIIVEGFFDVLNLVSLNKPVNVVCTFKAELSENQAISLLGLDSPLEIWYDSDAPGVSGAHKAESVLSAKGGGCKKVQLPVKDPGELDLKGFERVLENGQRLDNTISLI